jgi:hypothetical protein
MGFVVSHREAALSKTTCLGRIELFFDKACVSSGFRCSADCCLHRSFVGHSSTTCDVLMSSSFDGQITQRSTATFILAGQSLRQGLNKWLVHLQLGDESHGRKAFSAFSLARLPIGGGSHATPHSPEICRGQSHGSIRDRSTN